MDWTQYWFMFPVAIMVSTTAMASGIGGAALFMPIFVVIFPWLGDAYPFETVATASLVSLITMSFSFASGTAVYAIKHSIDYQLAFRFLILSIPIAVSAAWLAPLFTDWLLLVIYTVTIVGVSYGMLFHAPSTHLRSEIKPHFSMTAIGAFTTGSSSVGIGEVVMPQLIGRTSKSGIATGTSVFIVFVTVILSSITLGWQLARDPDLIIPWNVICYTVPGVLIGSQIGPRVQRFIPENLFRKVIACLFLLIAFAMIAVIFQKVCS